MPPIYTPKQDEDKTIALKEAIDRQAKERAKREPLLADQGKMERGLDEPKV